MTRLELMSVGSRRDRHGNLFEFSEADLQAIARSFAPAPLVPGHPPDDSPALGIVRGVRVEDGKLVATQVEGIDDATRALVNSGELPGVSVKLLYPGHPKHPGGDAPAIAHVGLLGRSLPADTGIASPQFAAPPLEAEFETHPVPVPEVAMPSDIPTAPEAIAAPEPTATNPPASAELSAAQAELEKQRAEFARQSADLQRQMAEFSRRQVALPWVDAQVKAGRVLPGESEALLAILSQTPPEATFSLGDKTTGLVDWLKTFVEAQPPRVNYGEVAGGEFSKPQEDARAKVLAATQAMYIKARKR